MASDELRARIAKSLGDVRLHLGSDAIALAQAGEPLRLSGGERDQIADIVVALVQPELDQLRAKAEALDVCYESVATDALAHGTCSLRQHGLLQRAEKAEAQRDHLASACRTVRRRLTVLGAALPPGLEFYVGKVRRCGTSSAAPSPISHPTNRTRRSTSHDQH